MARKGQGRSGWRLRALGALVLVAGVAGGWFWWSLRDWRPLESAYPDQGVEVEAADGEVNFRTVAAIGGSFAYLDASGGAKAKDAAFVRNLARAHAAGLQVGAVHRFDPCAKADGQSANFVTMVPRSADMLPPAITLQGTAENCPTPVSEAAVESELMTFINQVERHSGKPVILKVYPDFEVAYGISAKLERQLWVVRTRFEPGYAVRPWMLWSANEGLMTEAASEPLEWVVVRP
jgi:lysozyme